MRRYLFHTGRRTRATVLLMVVGLLAMLFIIITAYITLARFDAVTLGLVQERFETDRIVDSVNTLVLSRMRDQWLDSDGQILAGGLERDAAGNLQGVLPDYSAEDIPGTGGSRYLASLEPVRDLTKDPTAIDVNPGAFFWPAVTSLTGDDGVARTPTTGLNPTIGQYSTSLDKLMGLASTDFNDNGVVDADEFNFGLAYAGAASYSAQLARWARDPRNDADGDGIPDSSMQLTAPGTEAANAIGGITVRTPADEWDVPFVPAAVVGSPGYAAYAAYKRFTDTARYGIGQRVISHGGMVSLDAPAYGNGINPWNRHFVANTFNWARSQLDGGRTLGWDEDDLFDLIADNAAALEPILRRRGGASANFLVELQGTQDYRRVVEALRELEDRFPATFALNIRQQDNPWQRFNISARGIPSNRTAADWPAWRYSMTKDASRYNQGVLYGQGAFDLRLNWYDSKHLLTTTSYSDDLARDQGDVTNGNGGQPQLVPGQLKFYLGDITAPNNGPPPRGAFHSSGYFDINSGRMVIERLVAHFNEMLSGHDGWGSTGTDTEGLSRLEQARMLAVNTVAFAAPRMTTAIPGYVDVISYSPPLANIEYVGYGPQPYITQVLVHADADWDDLDVDGTIDPEPEDAIKEKDTVFAIELYNPNDKFAPVAGGPDEHALWLPQFAISFGDEYPGNPPSNDRLRILTTTPPPGFLGVTTMTPPGGVTDRFPGRSYLTIRVDDDDGAAFDNDFLRDHFPASGNWNATIEGVQQLLDPGRDRQAPLDEVFVVKLWRGADRNFDGDVDTWYVVDEFVVNEPDDPRLDPDNPADPVDPSWVNAYRDMQSERYFGFDPSNALEPIAAWRMTVGFLPDKLQGVNVPGREMYDTDVDGSFYSDQDGTGDASPKVTTFGQANITNKGPTVPLYTMNAPLPPSNLPGGSTFIHGSYRPNSFPTVGFMLFVPRFSHKATFGGLSGNAYTPAGEVIREHMIVREQHFNYHERTSLPADLGHMPVFDNHQDARDSRYFADKAAGPVPWGQLVFDYFTTINPAGNDPTTTADDIDPYRIPGRININTAPWWVLARIPVVGPMSDGSLPLNQTALGTPPSPAFWSSAAGILAGHAQTTFEPRLAFDAAASGERDMIQYNANADPTTAFRWHYLGALLAQSLAAYRDRVPYAGDQFASNRCQLPDAGWTPYWYADQRNSGLDPYPYRSTRIYGQVRRTNNTNEEFRGFLTIGELANVKGFDSTLFYHPTGIVAVEDGVQQAPPLDDPQAPVNPAAPVKRAFMGDYFKAVSLLALLDSNFITTRSNTFTVYTSVMDRENPQASVRSQVTIDRSNLLPRAVLKQVQIGGDLYSIPGLVASDNDNSISRVYGNYGTLSGVYDDYASEPKETPRILTNATALPEIIAERRVGYYNAKFDD